MIRLSAFVICFLAPSSAWSEVIEVRSGEHAGFSRIVMQFSDAAPWSVGRTENGYAFTTEAPDTSFDFQEVFNLIPRTRISKLTTPADGTLEIHTKQGFHADAFELREGRVVIDIKDGAPPVNSAFEVSISSLEPTGTPSSPTIEDRASQIIVSEQGTSSFSTASVDNLGENIAPLGQESVQLSEDDALTTNFFTPELDPLLETSRDTSELERALIEQLGRAASQGLLDVNLPSTRDALEYITPSTETSAELIIEPDPAENDNSHILIQTSQDRDSLVVGEARHVNESGQSCYPVNALDIAQWGAPVDEGLLLSDFRSAALEEFDAPSEKGVEDLAKYYLYLTFGSEAQLALKEFGVFVRRANALNSIAEVMDVGYASPSSSLKEQLECGGANAFWAAMSQEHFDKGTTYPVHEIGAYFSGLPLHLRRHLGPSLSERFLQVGDATAAQIIEGAISRVEGDHGDAFELLQAEMALANEEFDPALEAYEALAMADGPLAPDALMKAIKLRASQDLPVSRRMAEFAEILTIEHKHTPLESALASTSILARIHSGDADLALRNLMEAQNLERDDFSALLGSAIEKLLETGDDLTFARAAASVVQQDQTPLLPDPVKSTISERLLDVGFNELAKKFIESLDVETPQSRLSLAKISAAQGRDAAALGYLINLNSDEATQLRASLLMKLQRPEQAAEEFKSIADQDGQDAALFIAEDWGALDQSQNDTMSAVASLLMDDTVSEISANPSIPNLGELSELLQHSESTREAFSKLLE